MTFLENVDSCVTNTTVMMQNVSLIQKVHLCHFVASLLPHNQNLSQPLICLLSLFIPLFSRIVCQCNHTLCTLLRSFSEAQCNTFEMIHVMTTENIFLHRLNGTLGRWKKSNRMFRGGQDLSVSQHQFSLQTGHFVAENRHMKSRSAVSVSGVYPVCNPADIEMIYYNTTFFPLVNFWGSLSIFIDKIITDQVTPLQADWNLGYLASKMWECDVEVCFMFLFSVTGLFPPALWKHQAGMIWPWEDLWIFKMYNNGYIFRIGI